MASATGSLALLPDYSCSAKFDWTIDDYLERAQNCIVFLGPEFSIKGYKLRPGCETIVSGKPDQVQLSLTNVSYQSLHIDFMSYSLIGLNGSKKTLIEQTGGLLKTGLLFKKSIAKNEIQTDFLLEGKLHMQLMIAIKSGKNAKNNGINSLMDDIQKEVDNPSFCDAILVIFYLIFQNFDEYCFAIEKLSSLKGNYWSVYDFLF